MTEYRISEEELKKLVGAFCPMTRFDKERLEEFIESKKPIEPLNRDNVTKILKNRGFHKDVRNKITDQILKLSPQPIEYATPENLKNIIDTYTEYNEYGDLVIRDDDIKDFTGDLSQLAKPKQGGKK